MYGFVIRVTAKLMASKSLAGFVNISVEDTVLEDAIHLLPGNDPVYRAFHTSSDRFAKDETLVQDKDYDRTVLERQSYGLMKDLGISAKSFK
jgi:hypothetical protein